MVKSILAPLHLVKSLHIKFSSAMLSENLICLLWIFECESRDFITFSSAYGLHVPYLYMFMHCGTRSGLGLDLVLIHSGLGRDSMTF